MVVQVISETKIENVKAFTLSCGKKESTVIITPNYVSVCCKNISHKVWNGSGRVFHGSDGLAEARDSYKSGEMRAMIEAVIEMTRV